MTKQTPMSQLPYPEPSDIADVPLHLQALTQTLDSRTVMRFADAGARDVAVTQPVAGMLAWLNSPGVYTYYNNTAWVPYLLQDPPFAMYQQTAAQDLPNNGILSINWPTPVIDSYSGYKATAPTRYTPQVAGYYLVMAQVSFTVNTSGGRVVNVLKNGALVGQSAHAPVPVGGYFTTVEATAVAFCNGTTDAIEVQVAQSSGATLQTVPSATLLNILRIHS